MSVTASFAPAVLLVALIGGLPCIARCSEARQSPEEPVIGVLTYPSEGVLASCRHDCGHRFRAGSKGSYIDASYVQWLEQAGARVVAIRYDLDEASLRALFRQVNGVLFTGGPAKPMDVPVYFAAAALLYRLVLEAHQAGKVVPLWGTCLGLQTVACLAAGSKDILGDFPLDTYAYPLEFTAEARRSRLFGALTPQLLADFGDNVTTNWHSYGVSPKEVAKHAASLVPLATNVALNGKVFVSALEGRKGLPVYAVQFHPESNQFNAGVRCNGVMVPARSAQAIRTAQYFGNFFIAQARRNHHAFPSELDESLALVQQTGQLELDRVTNVSDLFPQIAYHFPAVRRQGVEDGPATPPLHV